MWPLRTLRGGLLMHVVESTCHISVYHISIPPVRPKHWCITVTVSVIPGFCPAQVYSDIPSSRMKGSSAPKSRRTVSHALQQNLMSFAGRGRLDEIGDQTYLLASCLFLPQFLSWFCRRAEFEAPFPTIGEPEILTSGARRRLPSITSRFCTESF
jgi:hypothetical protein